MKKYLTAFLIFAALTIAAALSAGYVEFYYPEKEYWWATPFVVLACGTAVFSVVGILFVIITYWVNEL